MGVIRILVLEFLRIDTGNNHQTDMFIARASLR